MKSVSALIQLCVSRRQASEKPWLEDNNFRNESNMIGDFF